MKNISILGIGKSGLAAALLAKRKGFVPFLSDSAECKKIEDKKRILQEEGIDFECGKHSDRLFEAEELILSPGIQKESDWVKRFLKSGKTKSVISEIEFASRYSEQKLLAITGSNGKTTTTTLLGRMLEREFGGKRTAGNIGIPLSDIIEEEDRKAIALELSSFQLETMYEVKPSSTIFLNLSPNHLDWYKDYEDYIEAKVRINQNNDEQTNVIYNLDDEIVAQKSELAKGKKFAFSLSEKNWAAFMEDDSIILDIDERIELIKKSDLNYSGPHHLMNMMAASIAAYLNQVSLKTIRMVLKEFNGLEHRMEFVAEINGVRYINDTKSTSIEALRMALLSFEKEIILIAGGKHKGASYKPLADLIAEKTKFVACIGASAELMMTDWKAANKIEKLDTLERALERCSEIAQKGDVILLSPACSSFDQFENFAVRGDEFKRMVIEGKKRYE